MEVSGSYVQKHLFTDRFRPAVKLMTHLNNNQTPPPIYKYL